MSKMDMVRAAMMQAMKDKDKERKEACSALLTALKNAWIDKREDLSEDEENAIVKKEIKLLQESIDTAPEDRVDIRERAAAHIAILREFAPEDMSAEQIEVLIAEVLAQLGLAQPGMKDKGSIMKVLMPKVKGKADGKLVNQLLEARLKA